MTVVSQTGLHPFDSHKYEFERERLSIRTVEMRSSAVVGVTGEFECLSEKDTEEACAFTLYSQ